MSDAPEMKGLPTIDVNEYGGKKEGERQAMNRRLFMQLLAFRTAAGTSADATATELLKVLRERKIPAVVYADTMDPRGLGLLTWSEDPASFVRSVRPLFAEPLLSSVELREEFAMLGRTYGTGHEPDLAWTLLRRPVENVTNEQYRWHVWYPLRRKSAFTVLEPADQGRILREHASLGIAYGKQELAHDVRLAAHGLDAGDNEFIIGLVSRELHPLSHLVQAMRKTRQTSEFVEKMGPFFVGYVLGASVGG